MIGKVYFETEAGEVLRPQEDYGILLVEWDAPPPAPQIYRVELDGADGTLDLSEWAGEMKYQDREVSLRLRDMLGRGDELIQALNGEKAKILFDDDPDWYYYGRCEGIDKSTRKRVTDLELTFTCEPYRVARSYSMASGSILGESLELPLRAARRTVVPEIITTDDCALEYGGQEYELTAGRWIISGLVVTRQTRVMTCTGAGDVTVRWIDEVL